MFTYFMGVGYQGFWKDHLRGRPYHIRYVPLRQELIICFHKLSYFVSYSCFQTDVGLCYSFKIALGLLVSAIMFSSCMTCYHGSASCSGITNHFWSDSVILCHLKQCPLCSGSCEISPVSCRRQFESLLRESK